MVNDLSEKAVSDDDLSKGYCCAACQTYHRFPAWVYAHWEISARHTCGHCGAIHELICGQATQVQAGHQETTASK